MPDLVVLAWDTADRLDKGLDGVIRDAVAPPDPVVEEERQHVANVSVAAARQAAAQQLLAFLHPRAHLHL